MNNCIPACNHHDAPTQARVPRCPGTDARVGQMSGYQVARVTFVRVSGSQVMWGCQGASATWVWALRAQTQGASGQRRGVVRVPRPLGFGPYGPKPKGPRASVGGSAYALA